jgi:hypothetical protein
MGQAFLLSRTHVNLMTLTSGTAFLFFYQDLTPMGSVFSITLTIGLFINPKSNIRIPKSLLLLLLLLLNNFHIPLVTVFCKFSHGIGYMRFGDLRIVVI